MRPFRRALLWAMDSFVLGYLVKFGTLRGLLKLLYIVIRG